MKRLACALLLWSALPACSLIQPLDAAKPEAAGGSSGAGGGASVGASGASTGGDAAAGEAGESTTGGTSGGAGTTGGTSARGGAGATGGSSARGGASGSTATAGGGGASAGAGATAGTGGSTVTGPYCMDAIAPCGGDLTGTWVLQSSCVILADNDPTVPAACQNAVGWQSYVLTGTVTFSATTVSSNTNDTWTETLNYTSACLNALHADPADHANVPAGPANTSSCKTVAGLLGDSMTDASCPVVTSGGTTSCDCTLNFSASSVVGSGTYKLVESNHAYVDEQTDPKGDYPVYYCIQGDTLTTSQSSASGQFAKHVLMRQSP